MSDATWRVECDCGYVVEGLTEERAARFAGQHADDECEPRYERQEVE